VNENPEKSSITGHLQHHIVTGSRALMRRATLPAEGFEMTRAKSSSCFFASAVLSMMFLLIGCATSAPVDVAGSQANSTASSNPPAAGSVTISWAAPTANTDGSAAALKGYRLYYGTSPTDLSHTIDINNPSQLSQLVGNLSAATWYFAVASVSSTGAESVLSNPVSATVK
jgi:hypothetical protein